MSLLSPMISTIASCRTGHRGVAPLLSNAFMTLRMHPLSARRRSSHACLNVVRVSLSSVALPPGTQAMPSMPSKNTPAL